MSATRRPPAVALLWTAAAAAALGAAAATTTLAPSSLTSKPVNERLYMNLTGDIMLGALFPVHRKGSSDQPCGRLQPEDGIQPLEAMLYTVQQINKDETLLPGVKLGMLAFDSCDNPSYGLEQALDFLKGFIAHYNEFHDRDFICEDGSPPKFRGGSFDQVVAVIGAQSSSVTIQVATMLRLFRIPLVSYLSTSPSLSNRDRYPYFFRTVPSDINQAHAMLEILRQFNWTYVAVVYSDNEYGTKGFETLSDLAKNYSICFSAPQRIDKDHFTEKDYYEVVRTIAGTEARVAVVFAEKATTLRLLEAARRLGGVGRRFVWIGSDAWSLSGHSAAMAAARALRPSDSDEEMLEGALAIQPLARPLSGFDDYFRALTRKHAALNPWFDEYWNDTLCNRKHARGHAATEEAANRTAAATTRAAPDGEGADEPSTATAATATPAPTSPAPSAERCHRSPPGQQRYLHFVRDAVYAVAHALHDLQTAKCGPGAYGVCDAMRHIDGDDIRQYLGNVTFKDLGGKPFRFQNGRDGPPRYSVLNFQRSPDGHYRWVIVGNYSLSEDGKPDLNIDREAMMYHDGGREFPKSTCSEPCAPHQIKVREKDETCCWHCKSCGRYEVRKDEFHCAECQRGERASRDGSRCVTVPESYIDFTDPWAIGAMGIASIGILLTIFVALIFWTYNDTPVIKASGRELSYLLLLGTLASFCVTFVIVARPSRLTCGLSRFFLGFCYTLCYAALVTKTNRIARIFNNKGCSPHKTKYTSPKSQLIITAALTSVEVIINLSWLLYVPPQVTHVFPARDERFLICEGLNDHSYMVSLLYPFVLIGFCTAYAIKTRKCPGGFNETRHIGFTNYTAIIIWLAFVPLYIASTSHSIRIVTLAISLSLSGLVQLGCLFFPKMYIVLFKPEKNTKEVVMSQHRSSSLAATPTNLTPVVVVNGGSMQYLPNTDIPKAEIKESASLELSNSKTSPSPSIWRSRQSLKEGRSSTPIQCSADRQSPDSKRSEKYAMVDQTHESPERRII